MHSLFIPVYCVITLKKLGGVILLLLLPLGFSICCPLNLFALYKDYKSGANKVGFFNKNKKEILINLILFIIGFIALIFEIKSIIEGTFI